MVGLGYIITLIDLFLRTSRFHDLALPGWHVPAIVMAFGLGALLLSGRIFQPLLSPIGRLVAFFTFWAFLSVGVSVWPGGAYRYLIDNWVTNLPVFFFICGFVRSFRQLKTVFLVAGSGYITVSFFGAILSSQIGDAGRTGVNAYSFGNSNDLALVVLLGLPLAVAAAADRRVSLWLRIYCGIAALVTVPVFFRTGSRAGLIALALMGMYMVYRQPAAVRIRLVLAALMAIPAGFALTPASVIARYSTILSAFGDTYDPIADPISKAESVEDQLATESAKASGSGRMEVLKQSIRVTLDEPLLGAGPGMFVVAENDMAIAEGRRRGYWKVSHNMYTQVSSELGIPALVVFLSLLVMSWKSLTRAERADPRIFTFAPELRRMALALKASMVVFLACGATLSIAYTHMLLLFCAIAITINRLLASQQALRTPVAESEPEQQTELAPQPSAEPAIARGALPARS